MVKYSLWNNYLTNVLVQYQYYENKNMTEKSKYLKTGRPIIPRLSFRFKSPKGEGLVKNTFSLLELDCITSTFPSEKVFKEELAKTTNPVNTDLPIVATYIYDSEVKELPLIYNSLLLYYVAQLERKKTRIEKDNKAPIDGEHPKIEPELNKLINQLCAIAQNDKTIGYITRPKRFMDTLTKEEGKLLKTYLKKGGSYPQKDGTIRTVYTLRDRLEAYARSYFIKEQNKRFGTTKINDEKEIQNATTEVKQALLKDYQVLRNAILFVKLVEKIEHRKKIEEASINEQIKMMIEGNNLYYNLPDDRLNDLIEYKKEEALNEDILSKYHQERQEQWRQKYENGSDLDDYGIDEIEEQLGEYKGHHR